MTAEPSEQASGPAAEVLCENCARPDADLTTVRRVYVVPAAWDTEGSQTTLDEVEVWCFSCRSLYPHEPHPAPSPGDPEA